MGYSVDVRAAGLLVRTLFISGNFQNTIDDTLRHGISLNPSAYLGGMIYPIRN